MLSNCFRARGLVYNRKIRDLYQVEFSGTLYEILVQLAYFTDNLRNEIQLLVIESADPKICIDDAVLQDLAVESMDPYADLNALARELEKKYREVYEREYVPPKIRIENNGRRIVIENDENTS